MVFMKRKKSVRTISSDCKGRHATPAMRLHVTLERLWYQRPDEQ